MHLLLVFVWNGQGGSHWPVCFPRHIHSLQDASARNTGGEDSLPWLTEKDSRLADLNNASAVIYLQSSLLDKDNNPALVLKDVATDNPGYQNIFQALQMQ